MVNTNGYAKSCTMSARSASAIRSNAPSTRLVIRSVRARMLRALNTGIIRWRSLVWSGGSMFSTEWSSTDWKSSPPPDCAAPGQTALVRDMGCHTGTAPFVTRTAG
jgi:hypothetical protein